MKPEQDNTLRETFSNPKQDNTLKGTLISVLLLGAFIIISWFVVFGIFISR
ncbi:cytochrome c oxidase subunit 2A [Gracilibacillus salitolerans]|uniref:Cytochrome c oxidase subunit 2A n=1 Tax=Gracilibacillus salitolerans TaxID=2663022 RepID=A0A5Q2TKS6_9BACI|nr:cytochrome c oxidase subunit 2A [Gracilibacillus salitolerans]QGH34741.1 cytochrome c oxidase subunit 2A [Gracilibacillus salitolerans]